MRSGLIVAALLASGCAASSPTTAPSPQPMHGSPSHIELSPTPGVGIAGGTVTILARVQDAYGATLPNVSVAFLSNVGSFAPTPAPTNDDGVARTLLTAPAGSASISARAGSITTTPLLVSVQPVTAPPSTPPSVPPTDPNQPTGPLSITLTAQTAQVGTSTLFALTTRNVFGVAHVAWDFGDGAAMNGLSTTSAHTYATVGSYTATAVVRDDAGRSASATTTALVTTAPPPPPPPPPPAPSYTVTLAASPTSVQTGTPTTLTATATALNGAPTPSTYLWDCLGTGVTTTTTAGNSTTCTYATVGSVTARVTVSNGAATGLASTAVTVTAVTPPAITVGCNTGVKVSVPATPSSCVISATVNGAVVGSGSIGPVDWDFGDGMTATSVGNVSPNHTYGSANTWTVVAKATIAGVTGKVTGSTTTTIAP